MTSDDGKSSTMAPGRVQSVAAVVIAFFTLLLAAAPLTAFVEGEENTLFKNHKWIVYKTRLAKDVMGHDSYYMGPQALAGYRLNLGAWHGYQEVLFREKVRPKSIAFDFHLAEGAYVVAEFDREHTGSYFGLRLSSNARFPHAMVEVDQDGGFLSKEEIPRPPLSPDLPHAARLEFLRDELVVYVNDSEWSRMPYQSTDSEWVGFRGGALPAWVDNVIVTDQSRGTVLVDRFDNRWTLLAGLWRPIGIGLLLACLVAIVFRYFQGAWTTALWNLTALHLCLAAATIPLGAYRVYVQSQHYPSETPELMRKEEEWVARRYEHIQGALDTKHTYDAPDDRLRVLFIGSSQTFGSGATEPEDTFVERIRAALSPPPAGFPEIECINTAIPGEISLNLYQHYAAHWIDYEPDLVVINLSVNDAKYHDFAENLHKFATLNRARSIDTLFVLEAVSIEEHVDGLFTHAIMRDVGEEFGVPVLDSHGYISERFDDGFLWWDVVHPTSYGHGLIADFLTPRIVEQLRGRR